MNRTELYEAYAQKAVEDMDIDALMDIVAVRIEDSLHGMPEAEAIEEIEQSGYAELLDEYDGEDTE